LSLRHEAQTSAWEKRNDVEDRRNLGGSALISLFEASYSFRTLLPRASRGRVIRLAKLV
jgi:hypothetical protein